MRRRVRPQSSVSSVICGDVIDVLRTCSSNVFDAVLCDPPYGLSFMGKRWDYDVPSTELWAEVLRVCKPGAALISFFGTRTYHRGVVRIEDAGWEIRDQLAWMYGCLSEDTEILVDGRWEPYQRATAGRLTLCYDIETNAYSWQPIGQLFVYQYDDTAYHIRSDSTDQIVSRNHRCIVERGGAYTFEFAEDVAREHEVRVPVLEGLSDLLRTLPMPNQRAGWTERTCSKVCSNMSISQKATGCPSPLNRRVALTCPICGKDFHRPPSHAARVKQSFCSSRCNGMVRGAEWKKHAHKGRAAWSSVAEASARVKMTGPRNPAWKGGITIFRKHGNYAGVRYVRCPVILISMARKDGYVMEHRLLVALALGRPLLRTEVVHHEDHNPTNNALANLALFMNNRDHKLYEHHGLPVPIWRGSNHSISAA